MLLLRSGKAVRSTWKLCFVHDAEAVCHEIALQNAVGTALNALAIIVLHCSRRAIECVTFAPSACPCIVSLVELCAAVTFVESIHLLKFVIVSFLFVYARTQNNYIVLACKLRTDDGQRRTLRQHP